MKDSELRSALLQFFNDQKEPRQAVLDDLHTALDYRERKDLEMIYDALEKEARFLEHAKKASERLIRALGEDKPSEETAIDSTPPSPGMPLAAPSEYDSAESDLEPFAQDLATAYNSETSEAWNRKYSPSDFGAENVNQLWVSGGEPKFVKKEGGVYNLVENGGVGYVVPEPGLRFTDSYFNSEGVEHLFEVSGFSLETPLFTVIRPATVEESGGRWTVSRKGNIQGRR